MSDDWTKDPSLGGFGNPNLPVPPIAPESGTVLAPPSPGSSTVPNWAFGGSGGRSRPQLPRSPKSLAIALAGQGDAGTLFPGTDQFVPLLPDHAVKPGDYWTKVFDQDFPFGSGHLHYVTRNLYVRDETVNGVNAAVISSSVKLPLDFNIDLHKLAQAIGQGADKVPSGAKMTFGGSVRVPTLAGLAVQQGPLVQ